MTDLSHPRAVMVAVAAFQRLVAGVKQLTAVIIKESTAVQCFIVICKTGFASFKSRGKHAKGQLRGNFEHHPESQACRDGFSCLFDRPPPRSLAIDPANSAGAGFRRGIFLIQVRLRYPQPACRNFFSLAIGPCRHTDVSRNFLSCIQDETSRFIFLSSPPAPPRARHLSGHGWHTA